MKRFFAAGMAVLLAVSGFTMSASAEEEQADGQEEETQADGQEEETPEDAIESLSIEEAVDYALEDNSSLILLNYRIDNIRSQLEGAEDDYGDMEDDIEDLEDQMDDLRDLQNETGERTFQTRLELQNQIETLEDNLEELEDSIKQMDSNEIQLRYDREEAHKSVELSTKSAFVQLLMQEDQMEMTEASLNNEEKQVSNVERQYELGTVSRNEYETAQREVRRLEDDLYEARSQYDHDLAILALDICIIYHEDLSLEEPKIDELQPIEQETDTETLIENSFSMQNAKEALELAEYDRGQVYDDEDATRFEKEQADIAVETEEENITQLRNDLTSSIEETFDEATTQYQAILQAQDELDYAKKDVRNLRVQADIGVIPESEYELAGLQVEQAEQQLASERWNLVLVNQQIEVMQDGLVQQSGSAGQGTGSDSSQQ
ncbi:TolC family protein [Salibacterium aidingense]|uniref:TolC family protein n=1 Tax=Salibacterium aidingense TaxID=384933 RepID=UPI000479FB2A|nr:TolC family protein [Salibacterium aidingense]